MKKFTVEATLDGRFRFEVEAESEGDARDELWRRLEEMSATDGEYFGGFVAEVQGEDE